MGRVYLVRHGQTDWNKEEIFRGTTVSLTMDDNNEVKWLIA